MSAAAITRHSTMSEVLEVCPSAQRTLFGRYHIGGYRPGDTLEEVARGHNILDVGEVVAFVEHAEQIDRRVGVSPGGGRSPRQRRPASPARRPEPGGGGAGADRGRDADDRGGGARGDALAQAHAHRLYCHLGQRSLDATSYYAGHGFTEVRSMTSGLDAWSAEVDPSVPRYEVARDPFGGGASLRPLRSAVSEGEGCQSWEGPR